MKRYVMLEDKTIIDRQDTIYQNVNEILMVKQSDNLIDLAEVGDCVECSYGLYNETYSINNDTQLNAFKGDNTVVAIWKRNGDIMRRYSVE